MWMFERVGIRRRLTWKKKGGEASVDAIAILENALARQRGGNVNKWAIARRICSEVGREKASGEQAERKGDAGLRENRAMSARAPAFGCGIQPARQPWSRLSSDSTRACR